MKTPICNGILQNDLDVAGFNLLNFSGGGGTNPLITVNVKAAPYNATGDGTTDDTVAIQSAINAVNTAGGGTVFFPRGTYLCNGAFDATNNSILQIPFHVGTGTVVVPITLLGEAPPVSLGLSNPACPTIKSTRTGTGTGPTLLASGPYHGGAILSNVNQSFTMVYIKNFTFLLPDNPTIGCIQLETSAWATLEDLEIETASGGSAEPTHGTVGISMPNSGNGGRNFANRIRVMGFDTAFKTGEHFRAPDIFPYRCKVGVEFLPSNNGPSWANICTFDLITDIKFSGAHTVSLVLDTEHWIGGAEWFARGTSIVDPSNFGGGEIKYAICQSNVGPISGPITMTGGNYLTLTDYRTGITTHAPSGKITGSGTVPAGGTVNQLLQKTSGTDYALGWVTPASGGNVNNSGTPTAGQLAAWTDATHIQGIASNTYQPLDADLTSWAAITRAANIDTWIATPNSANLRATLTDENGTGAALFNGATTPDFTTGFTIGAAAASGKIPIGNGTNYVPSTPTYPNAAGAAGYLVRSDATNFGSYPAQIINSSTASQSPSTSDVYLTGSNCTVAAGDFKAKGQYRCIFDMTKSAGTGAIVITLRIGTGGAIGDTAILTFTFGAGTAVADTGTFDVLVNWRSVGSGTSAVVQGVCRASHNLATTGLINNAAAFTVIGSPSPSSGFNSSTATNIGVSFNGATTFAGTTTLVQASLQQ